MRLGERQLQKKKLSLYQPAWQAPKGRGSGEGEKRNPPLFSLPHYPLPLSTPNCGLGAFAKELVLKCSYVKLNLGELVFKGRGNTPGGTTYIMALIAYTGSLLPKGVPFSPFSG